MPTFVSVNAMVRNPPLFMNQGVLSHILTKNIPIIDTTLPGAIAGAAENATLATGSNLSLSFSASASNIVAVAVLNFGRNIARGSIGFAYGYPGTGTEDILDFLVNDQVVTIMLFSNELRDRIRLKNETSVTVGAKIYYGTGVLSPFYF